jgi:hypothetical protein
MSSSSSSSSGTKKDKTYKQEHDITNSQAPQATKKQ